MLKTLKLKYSNPPFVMVIATVDKIHYKYFNVNRYGSIVNAKKAASKWIQEQLK